MILESFAVGNVIGSSTDHWKVNISGVVRKLVNATPSCTVVCGNNNGFGSFDECSRDT